MIRRWLGWLVLVSLSVALWGQAGDPVAAIRKAAWAKDPATTERLLAEFRSRHNEPTPQLLEAVSWAARGASFVKSWDQAETYAQEAWEGSRNLLKKRVLDADKSLPLALGAAIEVLGAARDARGDRGGAVEFLRAEHARFKGTSIETRIQKNLLLLTLEGQPAPPVVMKQWIGARPKSLADLKGQVALLFFWAHWCGDCKRQLPALERLAAEYASRGLAILGPTQLYGYVAGGETATPEREIEYLRGDYQQKHPLPAWMGVPIGAESFLRFGVSTTPTLVLVDRQGVVRLYNPGVLPYQELVARIEPLLRSKT